MFISIYNKIERNQYSKNRFISIKTSIRDSTKYNNIIENIFVYAIIRITKNKKKYIKKKYIDKGKDINMECLFYFLI